MSAYDDFLPVVQKSYDLNLWVLKRVERFPRRYKFTLGDRLQTAALDLALALVEASHARSRERPLYRANRLLDQLRILVRLATDLDAFSHRQLEYVSSNIEELGRMVGGWLRAGRTGKGA